MDNGSLLNILGIFITSLIALHIFNKWKNQKGSEVIANEARTVIHNIKRLTRYYNENNHKFDRNTIKDISKNGILLIESLIEYLDFIYRSIDNRQDKVTILLFSRVLSSNYYSYKTEPYRVCRRPTFLRECPNDKTKIYP